MKSKRFKGREGFTSRCPACAIAGRDSSGDHLMVTDGEDRWIHVRCIVGCSEDDVLGAMGLEQNDRRTEEPKGDAVANVHYVYTDDKGAYVLEKVRFIGKDGQKAFFQQVRQLRGKPLPMVPRKSGRGQRYQTPEEAGIGQESKPLYRLPQILKAIAEGKTVYVVEGEKAADEMWRRGLAATCQPDGAGNGKWRSHHTAYLLKACKVVVVADRDKEGGKYASQVFAALRSARVKAEIVRSKTTGEKDDAYDHLVAGFGEDDFVPALDLVPERGLKLRTLGGAFQMVEAKYLVEPYLPKGKCVLLDADGGTGKTTMALAWAAALSRGLHPLTFLPLPGGPVKTLYLHKKEDSDEELETVYRANRGVPDMLVYVDQDFLFDEPGTCELYDTILDNGFGLVIVDALYYFLPSTVKEAKDALLVLSVLKRLNDIAAQTGCTFLNIRHTTKGTVGKAASELGMGSVQFRNSHRGQLVMRWHPDKKDKLGLVVVTDEKGSLLVPRGEHFCYRRVDLEVQYVRNVPNPFDGDAAMDPKAKSKLEFAIAYIREACTGQYVGVKKLEEDAEALGISESTLKRARADLGLKPVKMGPSGGWCLFIEPAEAPTAQEPYDPFSEENYRA